MVEDTKVTLRMGPEELQLVDDFVAENPNVGSRSNLIRAAIRAYVVGDAPDIDGRKEENGIFVRFSEVQLNALSLLKDDGICLNEEEFVRTCVLKELVTDEARKESATNAFKTAQFTSKMK
ncbi:MAG TPA: ribbon-helix-helix domain-containing protein [Candidatus Methanomethylophilaceae archaeon]|nr:ribbon-helix-helix domain-containing protein [Candidatus Methanomethylophilaceae archaeon]